MCLELADHHAEIEHLFNDIRAQAIRKNITVDNDIYVSPPAGLLRNVNNSTDRRHLRIQMNRLFKASTREDRETVDIFSNLITKLPDFERLSPVEKMELTMDFLEYYNYAFQN